MENELKKRAKYHRKKQRGLPALSKLNTNSSRPSLKRMWQEHSPGQS